MSIKIQYLDEVTPEPPLFSLGNYETPPAAFLVLNCRQNSILFEVTDTDHAYSIDTELLSGDSLSIRISPYYFATSINNWVRSNTKELFGLMEEYAKLSELQRLKAKVKLEAQIHYALLSPQHSWDIIPQEDVVDIDDVALYNEDCLTHKDHGMFSEQHMNQLATLLQPSYNQFIPSQYAPDLEAHLHHLLYEKQVQQRDAILALEENLEKLQLTDWEIDEFIDWIKEYTHSYENIDFNPIYDSLKRNKKSKKSIANVSFDIPPENIRSDKNKTYFFEELAD